MEKTREEKIKEYKKSNAARKEKLALKAGFSTRAEYLASLEKKIKIKKTTKVKNKGIFYVIDILDASGSMAGGKYTNSVNGIKESIKDLTSRKDVKYSLIEFIQASKPLNKAVMNQDPSQVSMNLIPFSGAIGGDTPLYYTVYDTISNLVVNKEDKVLIKVYTDGGNNTKYDYQAKAAEIIKKVQKENFTITFVATPEDLRKIMNDINIDESNTLATANTAQGFMDSMKMSRGATMSYFASADKGENVLVGFYKKQEKL